MGTTVIGGMLAASVIGIFFVPAIFYHGREMVRRRQGARFGRIAGNARSGAGRLT